MIGLSSGCSRTSIACSPISSRAARSGSSCTRALQRRRRVPSRRRLGCQRGTVLNLNPRRTADPLRGPLNLFVRPRRLDLFYTPVPDDWMPRPPAAIAGAVPVVCLGLDDTPVALLAVDRRRLHGVGRAICPHRGGSRSGWAVGRSGGDGRRRHDDFTAALASWQPVAPLGRSMRAWCMRRPPIVGRRLRHPSWLVLRRLPARRPSCASSRWQRRGDFRAQRGVPR